MDIKEILKEKAPLINKTIEKWIAKNYDKTSARFLLGEPRFEYDTDAMNNSLSEPIWFALESGGKRWRPSLFLMICEALSKNLDDFLDFSIIPEIIHNGTLVVDDIEDNSETRRGIDCVYKKYGIDIAINSGNAMYYLPFLVLLKNKKRFSDSVLLKAYELYIQEMINLSVGQGTDIFWHGGKRNADKISEKQYLQMCLFKTGTLARFSAKLAAILCEADDMIMDKVGKFAETAGVAFQIQDDILDITAEDREKFGKTYGNDIKEGKKTLMVLYVMSVGSEEDKKRLNEILNLHTNKTELFDEAITILKKYKTIEYAQDFAEKLVKEAWAELDSVLKPSPAKEKLKAFADYLIKRDV